MPFAPYSANEVAKWIGGITRPPATTTRYLALFDDTDTEVTGGSYARQAVTFVTTGTDGLVENSGTITFLNMPTVNVESGQLFDASTSGNALTALTALSTPKSLTAGQAAVLSPGDITFTAT